MQPYFGDIREERRLNTVAIHEAAHAWLCLHTGRPFEYVSIVANAKSKNEGAVYGVAETRDQSKMVENLMMLTAGVCAENLLNGTNKTISAEGSDFDMVASNLVGLPSEQVRLYYSIAEKLTERILRRDWKTVMRIAQALKEHKTLTYSQLKALI